MIHKGLQTDIIREDGLSRLTDATVAGRRVSGRRVEFGQQEPSLGAAGVADDETGEGKAVLDEVLYVTQTSQYSACNISVLRCSLKRTLASCFGASSSSLKFSYPSIS